MNLIERIMHLVQTTVGIAGFFSNSIYIFNEKSDGIMRVNASTIKEISKYRDFSATCYVTFEDDCYKLILYDGVQVLLVKSQDRTAELWRRIEVSDPNLTDFDQIKSMKLSNSPNIPIDMYIPFN